MPLDQDPGIYIYFLAFRPFVRSLVHVCSGKTVGPRGSIFGRKMGPDSAMRGVPLHIFCIDFSQLHPIGSNRPPWAAGESLIIHQTALKKFADLSEIKISTGVSYLY